MWLLNLRLAQQTLYSKDGDYWTYILFNSPSICNSINTHQNSAALLSKCHKNYGRTCMWVTLKSLENWWTLTNQQQSGLNKDVRDNRRKNVCIFCVINSFSAVKDAWKCCILNDSEADQVVSTYKLAKHSLSHTD